MNDFVMTQLCADAMGISLQFIGPPEFQWEKPRYCIPFPGEGPNQIYDPLTDDAQAMALVKKFRLTIINGLAILNSEREWHVESTNHNHSVFSDLNRAIVECVANMQSSKSAQSSGQSADNKLKEVG